MVAQKRKHMKRTSLLNPSFKYSNGIAEVKVQYKSKIKSSERKSIVTSKDSFETLKEIFNPEIVEHHEEFVILLLNRANKLLGWAKISVGGLTGTVVDAKVIFQIALNCNAGSIILSHNHPSGNKNQSTEDVNLTKKIKEGGKLLDISILDHIIYTEESYFSFSDEGIL